MKVPCRPRPWLSGHDQDDRLRRYSAYGGQIDKVTLQIYPKDTDAKQG